MAGQKKKKFQYKDYEIDPRIMDSKKDYHLEQAYSLCVNELGLQQTKRDQIIAFYIAIISFVIPAIIELNLSNMIKGLSFLALFVLGIMLAWVVVRYRVYKEVYWITSRVLKQLYNFEKEAINKELVQHMFYRNLKKSTEGVFVYRKDDKTKVNGWKSYRKNLYSSESILFHILVLISSVVLWIGVYMLLSDFSIVREIVASVLTLANLLYFTRHYYKQLTKIYDVVFNDDDASFNAVFSKAWFLHFHLDFNENKKDSDGLSP
ncbi:hypothetical protein D3P07_19365 [Paenibacillus sp. 1011MAR3C5]|uniref:hypothetical protein n=1 Tax=Paenibacillus sp. 1011MAR3C5 TaxID=1675787 RepID=UPI000E6D0C4B|nr:hypothetical protein [Paenibacillus sp. 1011MAR3C5]RJE86234.1 hypothetical protein D3P07_19365 [Paenibacillus sp. 1011MAR3C5]